MSLSLFTFVSQRGDQSSVLCPRVWEWRPCSLCALKVRNGLRLTREGRALLNGMELRMTGMP